MGFNPTRAAGVICCIEIVIVALQHIFHINSGYVRFQLDHMLLQQGRTWLRATKPMSRGMARLP